MPTVKKSSSEWRVGRRRTVTRVQETRPQLRPRVTVDALPDDVLLEIFDLYLVRPNWERGREDAWHTLVHVCKRWRFVVFVSPYRLKLRLVCTNKRPVQNALDIWPELPIVIQGRRVLPTQQDADNIIAALKQHNRVCEIDIDDIPNTFLERIRAMEMRNPFSVLTSLRLRSEKSNVPALPDSFLGGSAPRLHTLTLNGIPLPALPKLLLSTGDLVELRLWNIPLSGYISPEAMVTGLSALTRLKSLRFEFRSPRSRANRENRLLTRMTHIVLPALTDFSFKGDSEYLEDIVAQIDTPLLKGLRITFFNQLIFDTPLLRHFISRTEAFKAPHRVDLCFYDGKVDVRLFRRDGTDDHRISSLEILCRPLDWQLSSLALLCNSALSPLTTLERLEVKNYRQHWKDYAENSQWVELLHRFTSVGDLVLHEKLIPLVAPSLEELAGESVTEVLPAIQNLFLQGPQPSEPFKKAIGKFVAARQLSGRPVAVHHRDRVWRNWQQVCW